MLHLIKKFFYRPDRRNFTLGLDRIISGKTGKQFLVALLIFISVLGLISLGYWLFNWQNTQKSDFGKSIAQAFVDMTSPVTVRNTVYDTNQNNSFIQSSKQESECGVENDTTALKTKSDNIYRKNTRTNNSQNEGVNGGYIFWLSFVYFIGAVVFSGLFIATITNILRTRADRFKMGTVRYRFRRHIVFIGYDDMIVGMIQKICDEEYDKVKDYRKKHCILGFFKRMFFIEGPHIVVGVENNVQEINDKIKNRIYYKHKDKVVVLRADSCNRNELEKRLRVPFAESVYIIGEHDDAYNLKSYRTIYEISLCQRNFWERMPQCYINLQHQSTLTLFQTYATASDIGVDFSCFHPFNFYDEWAKYLIVGDNLKSCDRIDYRDVVNLNSRNVHFVIVGMTKMGRALARQAALLCHYPNNTKTKITFIDTQAKLYSKQLIASYQSLFKRRWTDVDSDIPKNDDPPLDIEFDFYEADTSDDKIREKLVEWAEDPYQLLTIAICLPKASQSLAAGLYLPDELFKGDKRVPIWIYQPTYGDLGNYLKGSRYKNVVTFGMSGQDIDVRYEKAHEIAKYINHYFQNHKEGEVKYGNTTWIEAEWQAQGIHDKWMCINCANRLPAIHRLEEDYHVSLALIAKVELNRMEIERLIVPGDSSDKPTLNEEIEFIKELLKIEKNSQDE